MERVVSVRRSVATSELTAPRFKQHQTFNFICNANPEDAWTPERLLEELEIVEYGDLQSVIVICDLEYFDQTIEMVENWTESSYPVIIRLPALKQRPRLGDRISPRFLGAIDVESAYNLSGGQWTPTDELRNLIRSLFTDTELVTVES